MAAAAVKVGYTDPLLGFAEAAFNDAKSTAELVKQLADHPFGTPFKIGSMTCRAVITVNQWGPEVVNRAAKTVVNGDTKAVGAMAGSWFYCILVGGVAEVAAEKLAGILAKIRAAASESEKLSDAAQFFKNETVFAAIDKNTGVVRYYKADRCLTDAEINNSAEQLVAEAEHDAEKLISPRVLARDINAKTWQEYQTAIQQIYGEATLGQRRFM